MLSNVSAALQRFFARVANEEGQALAEYGLIIALVAVALVGILGFLALGLEGTFQAVINELPS